MNLKRALLSVTFLFFSSFVLFGQIDVMFEHDFENQSAGDTPDQFLPSGSASPDWDNAFFNPETTTIDAGSINVLNVAGNSTKKLHLSLGGNKRPVVLGANFNPSTDRFVVVEYDVLLTAGGGNRPSGEIYYADGYDDLDSSASSTVAINVRFNDMSGGGSDELFYTTGQDSDLETDDGTEWALGISWAANTWYTVRVIADQELRTFDIKVTDKSTANTTIIEGKLFNDNTAGYIRKVWFGLSTDLPDMYLDNVYIYQNIESPPPTGPTITFQEFSKGPINANTGLDIDFSDDSDLTSIQYRIGTGGTWTNVTSDGSTAINVSGASDTSVTTLAYILDTDFTGLTEGENRVYFRATDDSALTTESAGYLVLYKDTEPPNVASVLAPGSPTIKDLTEISGQIADAVSGVAADAATFSLQRQDNSQYWNGTAWQVGSFALATTHSATSDSTPASWTSSVALPPETELSMTVQATVNDVLGNGAYSGNPFTFVVRPGYPEIVANVSTVGPVRNNGFAAIDVDFGDDTTVGDVDLLSIEFKIGTGGIWTNLTSDGVNTFNLSGSSDVSIIAPVFITNSDFSLMVDGAYDLYFRATDSDGNSTDTSTPLVFKKDTVAPSVATITAPASSVFGSLPTVAGQVGDAAGGSGFDANSATFKIQRVGDSQYWTGSGWGADTNLATTHSATADAGTVTWVKNAAIPGVSDLDAGETYVFTVSITDRAGQTTSNQTSAYLFSDVPEVASVTDPADGSARNSVFTTVQGKAADHEGGAGLNANSATFAIIRQSDGQYWDGTSAWQIGQADLSTTHSAATGSTRVTWTSSATLPSAGDLSDGDYVFQAKATNTATPTPGTYTGASVTVTYDVTASQISSAAMAVNNSYVEIQFAEKVWGSATQDAAIDPSDFTVTFQQNGGGITASSVTALYADSGLSTSLGATTGYSTVYAALNNSGGPATGAETVIITAQTDAIYDVAANAMPDTETTGSVNLIADAVPTITSRETADLDGNGYIDAIHIVFSEPILDSTVNELHFSISGASNLVFSSTANGDIANDDDIYITFAETVGLTTGSTPNVEYTLGTLTDWISNALASTGLIASTDEAGPAILTAVASDAANVLVGIDADDTVTITFSENVINPGINAGNIDSILALSGGHAWVDGGSGIGSATWSNASTLVITLSDTTSDPTVAVGDTVTLGGGTVTDGGSNGAVLIDKRNL